MFEIDALEKTLAYQACVLLVDPDIQTLEQVTSQVILRFGWLQLSIGRELSAILFEVPVKQRARTAQHWTKDRLRPLGPGPVLLTHIDLLFEPTLALNPLSLLQATSRNVRMVVAWPGTYANGMLAYGVPEHKHYRTWRHPNVGIQCL